MQRYEYSDETAVLDHDQALDLARQYAQEHGKPFVVVGSAGMGFGPVAEERTTGAARDLR